MPPESDPAPRPFDVRTVEHLIGLMAAHDLTEIALREGDQRIRLRKGGPAPVVTVAPPPAAVPSAPAAPVATSTPAPAARALLDIKSTLVGTVYLRPKPDKDDFVKVGAEVKPDTTVCLIEAMKIFNDIKAEVAGTVAEVCVRNGDGVDFGTVLFRVDAGR